VIVNVAFGGVAEIGYGVRGVGAADHLGIDGLERCLHLRPLLALQQLRGSDAEAGQNACREQQPHADAPDAPSPGPGPHHEGADASDELSVPWVKKYDRIQVWQWSPGSKGILPLSLRVHPVLLPANLTRQ